MGIWTYSDQLADRDSIRSAVALARCPFCRSALRDLEKAESESEPFRDVELTVQKSVRACAVCGWWVLCREEFTRMHSPGHRPGDRLARDTSSPPHELRRFGAVPCLKRFSLGDLSVPLQEVRAYLAGRYEERFDVHPRKFEEVVASVFADLGYRTRVTSYSGDNGIDVVLDGPNDEVIGVQVKRHRNKIDVEQIRSLAGALVYHGITRGIFVTTSGFQSGAARTAQTFADRGYPIRLVGARRMLEALHIAQRQQYKTDADHGAPFTRATPVLISSDGHPLFNGLFADRMKEHLRRGEFP